MDVIAVESPGMEEPGHTMVVEVGVTMPLPPPTPERTRELRPTCDSVINFTIKGNEVVTAMCDIKNSARKTKYKEEDCIVFVTPFVPN